MPRDLYDIINLYYYHANTIDMILVSKIIDSKIKDRNINRPLTLESLGEQNMQQIKVEWQIMLAHQIANLPRVEEYIEKLPLILKAIENI